MSKAIEQLGRGGALNYSRGKRYSDAVCRFPVFKTVSLMVSGLYRDIYRGKEKRFLYTRVFRCVFRDGLGLKKEKKERVLNRSRLRDYELSAT